jgi:hypothetical protein
MCEACGRRIEWRRKWAAVWDEIRYCSDACRRARVGPLDRRLEDAVIGLLSGRGRGASICPSEAARRVAGPENWRSLMEATRRAARRLAARGRVEITQRGRPVDFASFKGPIRVRLKDR